MRGLLGHRRFHAGHKPRGLDAGLQLSVPAVNRITRSLAAARDNCLIALTAVACAGLAAGLIALMVVAVLTATAAAGVLALKDKLFGPRRAP